MSECHIFFDRSFKASSIYLNEKSDSLSLIDFTFWLERITSDISPNTDLITKEGILGNITLDLLKIAILLINSFCLTGFGATKL